MTCYLDANILIAFCNSDHQEHIRAKEVVNQLVQRGSGLVLSSLSLDELIHNSLRFAKIPKPQALTQLGDALNNLFKLPKLKLVNPPTNLKRHLHVVSLIKNYGLHARDAYHIFIMKAQNF